ncbi:MAG TPA: EamA family transporter [Edaphobacter sp.]|jgi:drug/metabolite transporter (DMT)-like permease|nr:EamA family transporter [Edaphobacter sp.]
MTTASALRTWSAIGGVAALAILGEVLIAAAMRRLGDLDHLRTKPGMLGYLGPIRAILSSPVFLIGAFCMAFNFFAMLYVLSIVDLSLAAPAIASLTYIGNAIAAKLFLGENVDRRRWLAVLFVCIGVILISH